MRKKNLLVICAASGLCLIFALILIGSMSIYAEKSGTQEFEPEADASGASDMLTKLIEEEADATGSTQDAEGTGSAEEAAGAAQEENATDTAANGASGAAAETSAQEEAAKAGAKEAEAQKRTEEADAQKRTEEEAAKASAEEAAKAGAEEAAKASAEAAAKDGAEEGLKDIWKEMYQAYGGVQTDTAASLNGISVNDAGLTLLKEIQHLYPKDSLADLKIKDIYLESMTDSADVYWTGTLENAYGPTEASYRSYSCQIDSVSGKIISFGKFQPYQKDIDYSAISWTDGDIKEHAKQLIETYGVAQGEALDWDSVKIYNGKEEIDSLKQKFAERPNLSTSVCNTLVFEKDGLIKLYFCMDWATGEISNYLWVD